MATKRHTPDRAFSEAEKMFLLGGFDALPEALDDLPEPEGMRIFGWFVGDAAAVFDRHREYLYAEAKRLGVRPVYRHGNGRDYFYAERMPPGGNRLVTDQ